MLRLPKRIFTAYHAVKWSSAVTQRQRDKLSLLTDAKYRWFIGLACCSCLMNSVLAADLRIVNGRDTQPEQWPWMVSIVETDAKSVFLGHQCGGTIIDREWILTAAHCVFDSDTNKVRPAGEFQVVVGTHQLSEERERLPISQIVVSERYDHSDIDSQGDIALLQLTNALPANTPTITLLAADVTVPVNTPATILGWGAQASGREYVAEFYLPALVNIYGEDTLKEAFEADETPFGIITDVFPPKDVVRNLLLANFPDKPEDGVGYAELVDFYRQQGGRVPPDNNISFEQLWRGLRELNVSPEAILAEYLRFAPDVVAVSDVLKQVELPTLANSLCQKQWDAVEKTTITPAMLCFGDIFRTTYRDSCSGDSGGPAVVKNGDDWVQVGITSYGYVVCGGQAPVVHTRVSAFTDLITTHVPNARFIELGRSRSLAQCPAATISERSHFDIPCVNTGDTQQWQVRLVFNEQEGGKRHDLQWKLPSVADLQINENCPTDVACTEVDADLNLIIHGLQVNGERRTGVYKALEHKNQSGTFYWESIDHSL